MSPAVRPLVLFLCTGNYYRSRFAERLFSARAARLELDWEADSRGLFEVPHPGNVGFMSPYALGRLTALGIDPGPLDRFPKRLLTDDLRRATRVVAIDETEHRAPLERRFPEWVERVDFWRIHDLDRTAPEVALAQLESKVGALVLALDAATSGETR